MPTVMRTKDEHLTWCRTRAMIEFDYYFPRSGLDIAALHAKTSMLSDLRKHPETSISVHDAEVLLMRPVRTREQMAQLLDNFDL